MRKKNPEKQSWYTEARPRVIFYPHFYFTPFTFYDVILNSVSP